MAHLCIKEDPGLTRMWVFDRHSHFIGKICNFKLGCVLSLYLHSVDFIIQIQVKNTLQSRLLKLAKQRIGSAIISKKYLIFTGISCFSSEETIPNDMYVISRQKLPHRLCLPEVNETLPHNIDPDDSTLPVVVVAAQV